MKRLVAIVVLWLVYRLSALISFFGRGLRGPARRGRQHIVLVGTFHNPNWMKAHVPPILNANGGNVVLVCDEPVAEFDGLTYACPPAWLSKIISRAGAKFIWTLKVCLKHRPYLVMGYHIFPAGVTALIAARLTGAFSGYQVTAGELELEGGGWNAENPVLTALGRPSIVVERAVDAAVNQFDLVVVRGSRALRYVTEHGMQGQTAVITGSVDMPPTTLGFEQRAYDIAFVGRLSEYKRPDRLLTIAAESRQSGQALRVLMVGDGPDADELKKLADTLGIASDVTWTGRRSDVLDLVATARLFVLPSRWEGVSIALLEAMGCGCVPVVSNVGDLADVVSKKNGAILDQDDIDGFRDKIQLFLSDAALWDGLSSASREIAEGKASVASVSDRWRSAFQSLV